MPRYTFVIEAGWARIFDTLLSDFVGRVTASNGPWICGQLNDAA